MINGEIHKAFTITEETKKEKWGDGPWIKEPDLILFFYKDVICRLERSSLGSWCGYVLLPENHPWGKEDYENINAEVHGGITYRELEESGWWIGFDCAHAMDITPAIQELYEESKNNILKKFPSLQSSPVFNQTYKDVEFVKKECESLVDQMISVKMP